MPGCGPDAHAKPLDPQHLTLEHSTLPWPLCPIPTLFSSSPNAPRRVILKTRLTPPLSPEQAAALYECFLRDTLDLACRLPGVTPAIAYLPAEERAYFEALAPDFELVLQEGANLGGHRLDSALTRLLVAGYQHVAIMNSDGPTLPLACLTGAFDAVGRRRGRCTRSLRRRRLLSDRAEAARAAAPLARCA